MLLLYTALSNIGLDGACCQRCNAYTRILMYSARPAMRRYWRSVYHSTLTRLFVHHRCLTKHLITIRFTDTCSLHFIVYSEITLITHSSDACVIGKKSVIIIIIIIMNKRLDPIVLSTKICYQNVCILVVSCHQVLLLVEQLKATAFNIGMHKPIL